MSKQLRQACEQATSLSDLRSKVQAVADDDDLTLDEDYTYVDTVLREVIATAADGRELPVELVERLPETLQPYVRELYNAGQGEAGDIDYIE